MKNNGKIEETDTKIFIFSKAAELMWIIFLTATFMLMIVMLNLLIAIISDTYDKVIATEKNANNYELANLMFELENRYAIDHKVRRYLVVASCQDDNNAEV